MSGNSEAQMTEKEALEWVRRRKDELGRWPMRRYRVEGSRCGNSGMLTQAEKEAKAAQKAAGSK